MSLRFSRISLLPLGSAVKPVPSFSRTRPSLVFAPLHAAQRPRQQSVRRMASAPYKFEWLVVVPDFAGVKAKRLAVRQQHLAGIKPLEDAKIIKFGGAILDDKPTDPNDANTYQFAGSSFILVAESREEIVKVLEDDIYAKEGVWDIKNATIWAVKAAVREAL